MKQVVILLVVVIGVFGLNALVLAELSEAEELIEAGDLDAALAEVDTILSLNPSDLEARFLKGMILTGQARNDEAIDIFTSLTHDYPALPEPYNNLGVLFTQQGDFDNARAALHAAILINPGYTIAHENLGDLYAKMAIHYYGRALDEDRLNESVRLKQSKLGNLFSVQKPGKKKTTKNESLTVTPEVEAEEDQDNKESESTLEPEHPEPQLDDASKKAILAAVGGWSAAWSAQHVDAFLAYYASDFKPSDGLTWEEWVARRRSRFHKPDFIKISVDQLKAEATSDATARVEFIQTYQSDNYLDQVLKILDMRRENGDWKIYREHSSVANWQVFREYSGF